MRRQRTSKPEKRQAIPANRRFAIVLGGTDIPDGAKRTSAGGADVPVRSKQLD
jgi:hypothetical protein